MDKQEWTSPKLEVLSTKRTAAGGGVSFDTFHDAGSGTDTNPSGEGS